MFYPVCSQMDAAVIKQGMIIGEVGAGRGRFTVHHVREAAAFSEIRRYNRTRGTGSLKRDGWS